MVFPLDGLEGVITCRQLIRDAEASYQNYLEKDKEKGRIRELLEAIEV